MDLRKGEEDFWWREREKKMKPPPTTIAFGILLAMLLVTPFGVRVALTAQHDLSVRHSLAIESILNRQTEVLQTILEMQTQLTTFRSKLFSKSIHSSNNVSNSEMNRVPSSSLRPIVELLELTQQRWTKHFGLSVVQSSVIQRLEEKAKGFKGYRYLVKWHGKSGIQMSPRYKEEGEAFQKFEDVGDYAKKLLYYDAAGDSWRVVRDSGGEQWLALIHNDGNAPEDR